MGVTLRLKFSRKTSSPYPAEIDNFPWEKDVTLYFIGEMSFQLLLKGFVSPYRVLQNHPNRRSPRLVKSLVKSRIRTKDQGCWRTTPSATPCRGLIKLLQWIRRRGVTAYNGGTNELLSIARRRGFVAGFNRFHLERFFLLPSFAVSYFVSRPRFVTTNAPWKGGEAAFKRIMESGKWIVSDRRVSLR